MRKSVKFTVLLLIGFLITACGGEPTPDPTVVAKMAEEAVRATLTAQPSLTPIPTDTPVPATNTPMPTNTPVPPPTDTPIPPTATPEPTPTDTPTATPAGPPTRNYAFENLGFSIEYPDALPLEQSGHEVISDSNEDFFFTAKVIDRDSEREKGVEEDDIAQQYTAGAQKSVKAAECIEFEVTNEGRWDESPAGTSAWIAEGICDLTGNELFLPLNWQAISVVGKEQVHQLIMMYGPKDEYLPDYIKDSLHIFEAVQPPAYIEVKSKSANLRAGPGTGHRVVGASKQGTTLEITGKNADGTWWEVCCVNGESAWVAGSVIKTGGDVGAVSVAENIPTPPPIPPTATPAPAAPRAGLHDRQTVSNWEIQPERLHKEKVVYHYGDGYVAMGNYAIVIVLAKNIAPGTDSMNRTLALSLRDDKGRVYDYSDPYSAERYANIAAAWQFVVHPTPFRNIDPGTETPLIMVWDVNEDVESLTLIVTDFKTTAKWDLGNFSNIPPYQKE